MDLDVRTVLGLIRFCYLSSYDGGEVYLRHYSTVPNVVLGYEANAGIGHGAALFSLPFRF